MISVITPVFNASRFLNKTIESVLSQKEVKEYILIDDGSDDDSWQIILEWKKKDKRIIALQHSDNKNQGRSATRNLGLNNAKQKYIAFLDADDFYLSNRFNNDLVILENDNFIDGVYNAIGACYYEDYVGERAEWLNLTTIKEFVEPEKLFENMAPFGEKGWFSGDGLTVKRGLFKQIGLFNEDLKVAEDTELWCKMAMKGKLVSGIIETPVAVRGVHGNNVFDKKDLYKNNILMMYQSLFKWGVRNNIPSNRLKLIWNKKTACFKKTCPDRKGELKLIFFTLKEIISNPLLLKYSFVVIQPYYSIKRILKLTFK